MLNLNEYSKRFAEKLVAKYPQWDAYIKLCAEATAPGSLELTIPAPNQQGRELYISTSGDEITIGFDTWHTHYRNYETDDQEDEFIGALDLLEEIVTEKLAVVSCLHDNDFCMSYISEAGEEPSVEKLNDSRQSQEKVNRFLVKSWKGTVDAEYDV